MFSPDRMIALDIGASKIVVAEFVTRKNGVPELINYGVADLGVLPESNVDSSAYIVSALRDLMKERGIRSGVQLYMSISGQAVFPRYVKLPPVEGDKIQQIVEYEAQQNVPFPIDEVVWDYQLLDDGLDDEKKVMLVAVKTENVTALTDCVQTLGLEPEIIDTAPLALYNLVRMSYPEITTDACTMVLDIGARSTNLVFVEGNKVFSRSITVAGNTISQEIMKEFNLTFEEAEKLKKEKAVVALGGVYSMSEDPDTEKISKIVRNVLTRLHAEVNRSINFYRSQQSGSAPTSILLAGGSSIIPHLNTFFNEKLRVDVEYLNPFKSISISPNISVDQLNADVTVLGEVVGLGVRYAGGCPIEINLMPASIVAQKIMRKRRPFFVASVVLAAVAMSCWAWYFHHMTVLAKDNTINIENEKLRLESLDKKLRDAVRAQKAEEKEVGKLVDLVASKTSWLLVLDGVHNAMLEGMWLTSFKPVVNNGMAAGVEIEGEIFEDKARAIVKGDTTVLEVFTTRLKEFPGFTDGTAIKEQPPLVAGDYTHKFKIYVALQTPIRIR
ncbi:MAG: type IV pilus assembly protein PilM [Kiritimatiellae bacterium]|nr:type IV pilus assembly protein PilM [Kiritimatiellia bacterium]